MDKIVIDLKDYRSANVKVFSGRDRGEAVRKSIQLDTSRDTAEYVFIVPEDIMSINESFFLGLFGPTIRKIGVEVFKQRFTFHCESHILKDIDDGISKAIRKKSALG